MCCFGAYLDNSFCLLGERIQLLTHKFGLNFHDLFRIFSLAKFLYKSDSSGNVFGRIAEKFFI